MLRINKGEDKHEIEEVKASGFVISDRRLWLTSGRDKLVEEGDLEAAELYATKGTRIPREQAVKFGLLKKKRAAKKAPPGKKGRRKPPSNKEDAKPSDK